MPPAASILTVTLNPAIDQTLTIPGFAAGEVNRVEAVQAHAGGKGVNVAAVLADLGESVGATGFLGVRNAGVFERLFAEKGIADEFIRLPGETRVGIKIVDPRTGQTTDINFPGLSPDAAAVESLCGRVKELFRAGVWVVLAGSVPAGVDVEVYARLIRIVREAGGRVALDTSGAALRAAIAAGPEVVKPNIAELSELAGRALRGPEEIAAAARSLLIDRGVRLAVVSMGAEGAVFVEGGRAIVARPPRVEVRSTVGAGDAMVAGLVHASCRGMDLESCAKVATALGAAAVMRVGAGVERDTLARLMGEVVVERVE